MASNKRATIDISKLTEEQKSNLSRLIKKNGCDHDDMSNFGKMKHLQLRVESKYWMLRTPDLINSQLFTYEEIRYMFAERD